MYIYIVKFLLLLIPAGLAGCVTEINNTNSSDKKSDTESSNNTVRVTESTSGQVIPFEQVAERLPLNALMTGGHGYYVVYKLNKNGLPHPLPKDVFMSKVLPIICKLSTNLAATNVLPTEQNTVALQKELRAAINENVYVVFMPMSVAERVYQLKALEESSGNSTGYHNCSHQTHESLLQFQFQLSDEKDIPEIRIREEIEKYRQKNAENGVCWYGVDKYTGNKSLAACYQSKSMQLLAWNFNMACLEIILRGIFEFYLHDPKADMGFKKVIIGGETIRALSHQNFIHILGYLEKKISQIPFKKGSVPSHLLMHRFGLVEEQQANEATLSIEPVSSQLLQRGLALQGLQKTHFLLLRGAGAMEKEGPTRDKRACRLSFATTCLAGAIHEAAPAKGACTLVYAHDPKNDFFAVAVPRNKSARDLFYVPEAFNDPIMLANMLGEYSHASTNCGRDQNGVLYGNMSHKTAFSKEKVEQFFRAGLSQLELEQAYSKLPKILLKRKNS